MIGSMKTWWPLSGLKGKLRREKITPPWSALAWQRFCIAKKKMKRKFVAADESGIKMPHSKTVVFLLVCAENTKPPGRLEARGGPKPFRQSAGALQSVRA